MFRARHARAPCSRVSGFDFGAASLLVLGLGFCGFRFLVFGLQIHWLGFMVSGSVFARARMSHGSGLES